MSDAVGGRRRLILGAALSGVAAKAFAEAGPAAPSLRAPSSTRLEPLRHVHAGVLKIAYYEAGPADEPVAILLHGFPYDIHSYVDVAPQLAARGCRVIVPYLRGFGATRFREPATQRSGGRRVHRIVPGAGHNLPQEAREAFAAAVMELVKA